MEEKHKVFVIPSDLSTSELSLKIIKLKHPRTGSCMSCILSENGTLFEIVSYAEKYSSWFIGDMVIEDGKMYMVTPIDPLFIILPYFYKEERYCRVEDILVDESFPDAKNLRKCCDHEDLLHITNHKDVMDLAVYSYDESKTLKWLKKKVQQVKESLEKNNIIISDGSSAENFISAPEEKSTTDTQYEKMACHLISEYVADDLAEKLCSSYGFSLLTEEEKEGSPLKQQQKRSRNSDAVAPLEDYSNGVSLLNSDKNKTKLTASQRKLQKADKSGMKNISAFFQKK